MRFPALVLLTTLAAALPADAQDRRERVERVERVEREMARAQSFPRVLQMTSAPRAVLGIATSASPGAQDTLGVLVSSVTEESPAARAGIREGDRLQSINGISLRISAPDAEDPIVGNLGMRRLTRELARKKAGDEVDLRVATGNQARNVRVRLADSDSVFRMRSTAAVRAPGAPGAPGMRMRATSANRASLGIQVGSSGSSRDTLGVFVMSADDDGPAVKAGIVEGARIAAINGTDLRLAAADAEDNMVASARVQRLMRTLSNVKPGDEVELRVWQNGQYRTTRVRTVPADSLRRTRSTFIIGDGMRMEGMQGLPSNIRVPRGVGTEAFQFHLSPEFHRDLEVILDGAFRGARGALEGAARELPTVSRTYH